jgi:uncharacterized protein (TIGR00369 family)
LFERVQASFSRQGLLLGLGVRLLRVEAGLCELALPYSDKVTQQQGGFHGGAIGALADVAGGYAALTTAPEGMEVTFMNAFQGGELRAIGRVVKAGRRVIVTTAEVVHLNDGQRRDCAIMQQTLAPVTKTY